MEIKDEIIDFLISEMQKDNYINKLKFGKFCFKYYPETDLSYPIVKVFVENKEITDLEIVLKSNLLFIWKRKIKTLKYLIDNYDNIQKEKLYFSYLPEEKKTTN